MRPALYAFVAGMALAANAAHALRADNFVLLDQLGKAHELHYYKDAPAVAIMVQGNGCPIVRNALGDYKALRDRYRSQGVAFFMLNANLQDSRAAIRQEALAWDIDMPILNDEAQLVGESLQLIRTAEVLIIDPQTWQVAYRGPLNDRISGYERQRAEVREHYAADALDALLQGAPVAVAQRDAIGCLINFPERSGQHDQISYSEQVAPILQQNCVVCHQEGGIGPWAMSGYPMVRGFAPMIREVIRTRRMPPWHADPHIGTFKNGRSLTVEEAQTLVHWAEAGAPRGAGPDPLAQTHNKAVDWPLGRPDLIIDIPPFTVPANGVVEYRFPVVRNPLDEAVWVVAVDILPGDRNVVHHVLLASTDAEDPQAAADEGLTNYISGYAPGNQAMQAPPGTGILVPGGGHYQFQMHYTPYGKTTVDRSKLGLYFADQPPANFLRQTVVVDPTILIPANSARHREQAYLTFERDALLHSLVPHSHYRGVASEFELLHPDGRSEIILSVPDYDFNWQRTYEFAEAVPMPAGSRLIHRTVYDNSTRNPGNPDPGRDVPWGLQSWDEMLYGAVQYTWVDETTANPIHDENRQETFQMVGFMDQDMDGKLAWNELPGRLKKRLADGIAAADANGDGGLDVDEILSLQQRRQQVAATAGTGQ